MIRSRLMMMMMMMMINHTLLCVRLIVWYAVNDVGGSEGFSASERETLRYDSHSPLFFGAVRLAFAGKGGDKIRDNYYICLNLSCGGGGGGAISVIYSVSEKRYVSDGNDDFAWMTVITGCGCGVGFGGKG